MDQTLGTYSNTLASSISAASITRSSLTDATSPTKESKDAIQHSTNKPLENEINHNQSNNNDILSVNENDDNEGENYSRLPNPNNVTVQYPQETSPVRSRETSRSEENTDKNLEESMEGIRKISSTKERRDNNALHHNNEDAELSIMKAHKELEALSLRTSQSYHTPENDYEDDGGTIDTAKRLLLTRKGFPPATWALLNCFPENDRCMDCDYESPDWACINWGTLICYHCSLRHRQLGSRVTVLRSMTKDSWNLFQVVAMLEGGNGKLKTFFDGSGRRSSGAKSGGRSKTSSTTTKTLVELWNIRESHYKHKNSVKYQRDLGQRAANVCASHGCPISFDDSTLVDK